MDDSTFAELALRHASKLTTSSGLREFARAVALAERESCAKVCDEIALKHQRGEGTYAAGKKFGAFECAAALRPND